MSRVLKAEVQAERPRLEAFNLEDISARAGQVLDQVRAEAAEILRRAQQEAVEIKRRADVEGRKAANETIDRQLDAKVRQQMETVLPALRDAIAQIQNSRQAWLTHWEQSAVRLAAAIAARVLRQERVRNPQVGLPLVREALELAAGSPGLRVHLHPADLEAVRGQLPLLSAEFSQLATAELIGDPQVSPGGCVVHTEYGTIDQRFEAQLQRIEAELT